MIKIIGCLGSALAVVSMLMSSVIKLRAINTIGKGIPSIAKSGSAACPPDRIPPYPIVGQIVGKTNSGGGQRPPPVNFLPTNRKSPVGHSHQKWKEKQAENRQNKRFSVPIVRVTRLECATSCSQRIQGTFL